MSLIQPEFDPRFRPAHDAGDGEAPLNDRGVTPEAILRGFSVGLLVVLSGLALGGFTFHEMATRGTAYFVVAACLGIVLTAFAYQKFQMALVFSIALMFMRIGGTPGIAEGGSGEGKGIYPVQIEAAFLLFIWALRGIGMRNFHITRTPMNGFLVAYLLYSVWSAINGWMFWDPMVTHYWGGLPGGKTAPQVIVLEIVLSILSIGMFWVMASNLTDPKWLRRASFLLLLPGLMSFLAHVRLMPEISNVYDVLTQIVLTCTIFAWLLENPGARPGLRLLAVLFLMGLVFQTFFLNIRWISGWIGMFAGLLCVAWLKSKKLCVAMVCTGVALVLLAQPFLKASVLHKVQTSGDLDRFSMMRASLMYALKFPLGIGPGNYRAYNAYYGGRSMWNTSEYTSAHDFYAQVLSERGFIGLILALSWVIMGGIMLARFYKRTPPGFSRTVTLGIAGMWAGMCASSVIGDYLIPVYHNGGLANMGTTIYAWIGLGIAVAHARQSGLLAREPVTPSIAAPQPPAVPLAPWPRRSAS
jgi:hypothetical protein